MIPFTGDGRDRPLNVIKDNINRTNGTQNAPIPSRSNRPPDMCVPTVQTRLCALPKLPATFQNSLSRGEKERRLPPRTNAKSRKMSPLISFLSGCRRFSDGTDLDCSPFLSGLDDDCFFFFILILRSQNDDGRYDEGASFYDAVEKSFQPSPDFCFQPFIIHRKRLLSFVHHL